MGIHAERSIPLSRQRRRFPLGAGAALAVLGLAGAAPPRAVAPEAAAAGRGFEVVTATAGVAKKHTTRRFDNPYAEIMAGYTALGAAAAVADYDGDGFEDLFVTDSSIAGRNHLYHNNGDLTFTDVAAEAGVADGNDASNASAGALWLDFNNDGRPDLLVVRFGHNRLYENLGSGRFADVTRAAGLDRYANAICAIAFDYDRDGRVDILVGNYFQPVDLFHPATPRFFPESFETARNGGGLTLWHNDGPDAAGHWTFSDRTARAGLAAMTGWTLAVGHGDADGDGYDDLYVACDFGTDHLFVNRGDGTFRDATERALGGFDTKKGMNAEWGDYDGDGRLDVFVTNITDDYMREGNFLWHNNGPDAQGEVTFTDVAREAGVYDSGWGWGGKFFDYDNDGWLDLYVVDGWVSAGPESYVPDIFAMAIKPGIDLADARNWPPMGKKSLSGYQKKRLFHNLGGQFRDEAARHGLDSVRDGRGVAVADFDNDGRMDLFVTNAGAEPYLYHNVLPLANHWVELVLQGEAQGPAQGSAQGAAKGVMGARSNRAAVGAQVRLTAGGRTLLRFVDGGNGFAGQSTERVHFGLGGATAIDRVEVRWPSGARTVYAGVPIDRIHRLLEGRPDLLPFHAEAHKR